ncbi:MAG: P-II family nitrogen regulator [Aquificaceae bacterium]|jgi:nitrogen regulatory protein PII 1|uniref:P-II family nitrogen regulator n=1 Tax=Hydrogenobacter sp. Uz 6-8 TaxID=3384828 RepID=UPI000F2C55F5|nr:MAG: P-II family nitrogen regulator [Aquificota bacterium]
MKMVKAIIRPEKLYEVVEALEERGFRGFTVMDVVGRGREGGLKFGDAVYLELAKTLLLIAVRDEDVERVVEIIKKHASLGMFGDGKVFVCPVEEVWTIRTGKREEVVR